MQLYTQLLIIAEILFSRSSFAAFLNFDDEISFELYLSRIGYLISTLSSQTPSEEKFSIMFSNTASSINLTEPLRITRGVVFSAVYEDFKWMVFKTGSIEISGSLTNVSFYNIGFTFEVSKERLIGLFNVNLKGTLIFEGRCNIRYPQKTDTQFPLIIANDSLGIYLKDFNIFGNVCTKALVSVVNTQELELNKVNIYNFSVSFTLEEAENQVISVIGTKVISVKDLKFQNCSLNAGGLFYVKSAEKVSLNGTVLLGVRLLNKGSISFCLLFKEVRNTNLTNLIFKDILWEGNENNYIIFLNQLGSSYVEAIELINCKNGKLKADPPTNRDVKSNLTMINTFIANCFNIFFSFESNLLAMINLTFINNSYDGYPVITAQDVNVTKLEAFLIISNKFKKSCIFNINTTNPETQIETTFTLKDSVIFNNSQTEFLGLQKTSSLILQAWDVKLNCVIENTNIASNTAVFGNTIFYSGAKVNMKLNLCCIYRNKVNYNSYFGLFEGETINMTTLIIYQNDADAGLGLSHRGNKALISGVIFFRNSAFSSSLLNYPDSKDQTIIDIDRAICFENFGRGSGFYIGSTLGVQMTFFNSILFGNKGELSGGAFKIVCNVYDNVKYNITLRNLHFCNNSANRGAAISFAVSSGLFKLENSIFTFNKAVGAGGAISSYSDKGFKVLLLNCVFSANFAKRGGALIFVDGNLSDYYSIYINNSAVQGSTLQISSLSKATFENSVFTKGFSHSSNNLIFTENTIINLRNSTIAGCFSNYNAAGVSIYSNAVVNISNCTFHSNKALSGVILYTSNSRKAITISDCIFYNNTAQKFLIMMVSASLLSKTLVFRENMGSIFLVAGKSNLTLHQGQFFKHFCGKGELGCIMLSKLLCHITFSSITISEVVSFENRDFILSTNCDLIIENSRINIQGSDKELNNVINLDASNISIIQTNVIVFRKLFLIATDSVLKFANTNMTGSNYKQGYQRAVASTNSDIYVSECLFYSFTDSAISMSGKFDPITKKALNLGIILNSTFLYNSAISGGALTILNMNFYSEFSIYSKNTAESWGGTISMACNKMQGESSKLQLKLIPDEYECDWKFFNNSFSFNQAKKGGGVVFWLDVPPLLLAPVLNYFNENKAIYGEIVATIPLYMFSEGPEPLETLRNFSSGSTLNKVINITLRDFYGQIATAFSDSQANIQFSEIPSTSKASKNSYLGVSNEFRAVLGKITTTVIQGTLQFEGLKIYALPTTSHILIIQSEAIPYFDRRLLSKIVWDRQHYMMDGDRYAFLINATFDKCYSGQIFYSKWNSCEDCPSGTYTFVPTEPDGSCYDCPINAVCKGRDIIEVNAGYWRSSNHSKLIYKCENMYACKGGIGEICIEGYQGILCDVCKADTSTNEVFFMDIDKKCKSCSSGEKLRATLVSLGMALLVLAYMVFMIRKKMKSLTSNSSVLLKILTDYIQVVGLVTSLPSKWPSSLSEIFQMQSNFNNPNTVMSSSDCTFGALFTDINPFFQKIILATTLSVMIPAVTIAFLKLNGWMHSYSKQRVTYSIQTTLIILFFNFQPSFINLLFGALTCREIEGKLYLKKYIKQVCWNEFHQNMLFVFVVPPLMIWMFGAPALLIFLTWRVEKRGKEIGAYSFMTYGYLKKYFFWDFIVMFNKFSLILCTTFIFNDELISFILMKVSLAFLFLQVNMKPYSYEYLNYVVMMSRIASHSILICSVVGNLQGGDIAVGLIVAVVALVNLIFFALWFHTFLRFQKAFTLRWNKYCPYSFWKFNLNKSQTVILKEAASPPSANNEARVSVRTSQNPPKTKIIMLKCDKK